MFTRSSRRSNVQRAAFDLERGTGRARRELAGRAFGVDDGSRTAKGSHAEVAGREPPLAGLASRVRRIASSRREAGRDSDASRARTRVRKLGCGGGRHHLGGWMPAGRLWTSASLPADTPVESDIERTSLDRLFGGSAARQCRHAPIGSRRVPGRLWRVDHVGIC